MNNLLVIEGSVILKRVYAVGLSRLSVINFRRGKRSNDSVLIRSVVFKIGVQN